MGWQKRTPKNSQKWPWLIGGLALLWMYGQGSDPSLPLRPTSHIPKSPPIKQKVTTPLSQPVKKNKPSVLLPPRTVKSKQSPPLVKPKLQAPIVQYVDASRLNVRNGPSKKNKVIWTLKRDQQVTITQRKGVWAKIRGPRFKGWVHSGFLTPKPSPHSQPKLITKSSPHKRKQPRLTDSAIVKILIKRSFAYYSGNCPCPYNRTARGRRCGRRSAYSRPGGASPLCFPRDISVAMIRDFRERQ